MNIKWTILQLIGQGLLITTKTKSYSGYLANKVPRKLERLRGFIYLMKPFNILPAFENDVRPDWFFITDRHRTPGYTYMNLIGDVYTVVIESRILSYLGDTSQFVEPPTFIDRDGSFKTYRKGNDRLSMLVFGSVSRTHKPHKSFRYLGLQLYEDRLVALFEDRVDGGGHFNDTSGVCFNLDVLSVWKRFITC